MNNLQLLSVVSASQGLLMALVLLALRHNYIANRWLALYILATSTPVLLMVTMSSQSMPPVFAIVYSVASTYVAGPLLYFYVRSIASPVFHFKLVHWLHFLPALVCFAALYLHKISKSPEMLLESWQHNFDTAIPLAGRSDSLYWGLFGVLWSVSYVMYCLTYLGPLRRRVQDYHSALEEYSFRWLQFLLLAVIFQSAANIFPIVAWLVGLTGLIPMGHIHLYMPRITLLIVVNFIALMAIRQSPLFGADTGNNENERQTTTPAASSYRTSSLNDKAAHEHWLTLELLIKEEQIHRINGLTLAQLAERVGISSDHLTQVINKYAGRNFYEYINSYRLEEARRRLLDLNEDLPLKTIGYEVGFNSQSAFYKQFARQFGMSPGNFRNNARNQTPALS